MAAATIIRNANPTGANTGDCIIRAMSTTTGEAYESIQRDLGKLAVRHDSACSSMSINEATDFITRNGSLPSVWTKLARAYGLKVTDVRSDNISFNPQNLPSNCFIATSNHAVALQNGQAVDTWDSVEDGTKKVNYIVEVRGV